MHNETERQRVGIPFNVVKMPILNPHTKLWLCHVSFYSDCCDKIVKGYLGSRIGDEY